MLGASEAARVGAAFPRSVNNKALFIGFPLCSTLQLHN